MLKGNLTSLRIGQTLAQKGGERLMRNFIQSIRFHKSVEPGDILQVEATPTLRCQKIVFVECLPWHAASGNSEKVKESKDWAQLRAEFCVSVDTVH